MKSLVVLSVVLTMSILFTNCSKYNSGVNSSPNQIGHDVSDNPPVEALSAFKTLELYKFNPSSGAEIIKIDLITESATFTYNSGEPIHCQADIEIKSAIKKFKDSFLGVRNNAACLATAGTSDYVTLNKANDESVVFNCPEQFSGENEYSLVNQLIESYQHFCNLYSTN